MVAIDEQSTMAETGVKTSMAALRREIDQHETSILQQISILRNQEKQKMNDYKGALEEHSQEYHVQKAKLENLRTDGTQLMQSKEASEISIQRSNETLKAMQIPRLEYHHVQGIDQLQSLKEQIAQCGRYVKYSNPKLERLILNRTVQHEIRLDDMGLTRADMEIVADAIRSMEVTNSDCCFAFEYYQSPFPWME